MGGGEGIPAGNREDKYHTTNPIARRMVDNFLETVAALLREKTEGVSSILEVGCGEGHLAAFIASLGVAPVKGCDFSADIIAEAERLHGGKGIEFYVRSIYDLEKAFDWCDLLVCCEVLEHLERPEEGLRRLAETAGRYVLLSVPREPVWRVLNVLRGKYLGRLGNTPGHINHWSPGGFRRLVSEHLEILETRSPFPWTMVLARPR
ncbi:MAG: class I SAM-dependent methyltransferase [Actinobacteria bacterium]|nr:class I SAM-dependent methyltransferase [Actinomycetota bacterium]